MLTRQELETILSKNPLIQERNATLRKAQEINPELATPHIWGGYLRNIILERPPRDCDVIFHGRRLNQPGIIEAVREAEVRLGITPYPEWEFENIMATGPSNDFYANAIGEFAPHTDYLTRVVMDTNGKLYFGDEVKSLHDLSHREYDLCWSGIHIWANHRAKHRSLESCIVGDLTRGLYMIQSLDLTPSASVAEYLNKYDALLSKLAPDDQKARIEYWLKKTNGDPMYQQILDQYVIKSLRTNI